jgi:hypothetical protein
MIEGHTVDNAIEGPNVTSLDDLAQLEAERDRLLSMVAYHNDGFYTQGWWSLIFGTSGATAGEPEARQRLAECEARIIELKERRS